MLFELPVLFWSVFLCGSLVMSSTCGLPVRSPDFEIHRLSFHIIYLYFWKDYSYSSVSYLNSSKYYLTVGALRPETLLFAGQRSCRRISSTVLGVEETSSHEVLFTSCSSFRWEIPWNISILHHNSRTVGTAADIQANLKLGNNVAMNTIFCFKVLFLLNITFVCFVFNTDWFLYLLFFA